MRRTLSSPGSAATLGAMLCVPLALILGLIGLGIHPDFGQLGPLFATPHDQPQILGLPIIPGCALLLPVAHIVVLTPALRSWRTGGSITAHRINLLLAATILLVTALITAAIIADQYPCWIGVPNCD